MSAIGIDIGGTSIKGGLVDNNGKVIYRFTVPVTKSDKGEVTVNKLIDAIKTFVNEYKIDMSSLEGIGIGCPGAINSLNGVVDFSNNLDWHFLPLSELIQRAFGVKVKITNDANAATLGEAMFGSGKKYKNIIMLTLGTGVGGGIIVDGKLYEGNAGKGAELGHITLVMDGEKCSCGRKGCFEVYASATALIKQTKKAMEENKDSLLWKLVDNDINKVNGETPFIAYKENDKTAIKVIDNYIHYLGEGILNYCNIFRPDAVILSGGIAKQGKFLTDKLTDYCKKRNYGYKHTPDVDIITAELGYDSGIIGAAALIIKSC